MSKSLLLLFGLPRSGTTWIGKIFDSHPDTLYLHEPDRYEKLTTVPSQVELDDIEKYRAEIESYISRLDDLRVPWTVGKMPIFHKNSQNKISFHILRSYLFLTKFTDGFLDEIRIPKWFFNSNFHNLKIVWKSIESVGRLGVILRVVPGSRGILIIRHPCGQIASTIKGDRMGKLATHKHASEDYGILSKLLKLRQARQRGITLEYLRKVDPVERLAWRWVLAYEKAIDDIDGLSSCTILNYDEMTKKPQEIARKLFEFVGLNWNAQTEDFLHKSICKKTDRYYSVFKKPTESAYKWKKDLSREEIKKIHEIVSDSKLCNLFQF